MTEDFLKPQALNRAMMEAVEFVHREGWYAPPTLFALVPSEALIDALPDSANPDDDSPLTLLVDNLPDNLAAGSEELEDYINRLVWPEAVAGAILAQEIMFTDTSAGGDAADAARPNAARSDAARPARLFSGVLRGDAELTLLQLRPTEEELAAQGPFAEDDYELLGGPEVAPGVIGALRNAFSDTNTD